jgi:hypothetical protein
MDPFSNDEFDAIIRWYPTDQTEKASARFANQNMILAIGAQCAPVSGAQAQIERECLASAQSIASSILLESPSLQGIQTFLLLAFYMLGACRRNAAFMYLGVAARAAHALGLHNAKLYESLPASSVEQQYVLPFLARSKVTCANQFPSERIWKSLVTLEFVVTSILGREPASLLTHPGHANFDQMMHTRQRNTPDPALQASYQLSWLINDVMSNFYQRETVTIEAAQLYMEKIDIWLENLDESLSLNDKPSVVEPEAWAQVIGSLHVSCFYHFAVTLICRPFLIQQLRRRLGRKVCHSGKIYGGNLCGGAPSRSLQGEHAFAEVSHTKTFYHEAHGLSKPGEGTD